MIFENALLYFLLVLVSVRNHSANGQCFCETAYECADQILNDSYFNTETFINICGYKGAWNASIDVTGGNNMYCLGTRSCENLSLLRTTGSLNQCQGSSSCRNINRLTGTGSNAIDCHGSVSCALSTITQFSVTKCQGDFSCAFSTISETSTIQFEGAYAGYNSNIYAGSTVKFMGYYSGYNATVICESGDYCFIECYGSGCVNTRIVCLGNANCPGTYGTSTVLCVDGTGQPVLVFLLQSCFLFCIFVF